MPTFGGRFAQFPRDDDNIDFAGRRCLSLDVEFDVSGVVERKVLGRYHPPSDDDRNIRQANPATDISCFERYGAITGEREAQQENRSGPPESRVIDIFQCVYSDYRLRIDLIDR